MERIIFSAVPLLFTMIFSVPALSLSAVIYVDEDASGTNTGTSWANAFVNLQSGLTTAEYSDEVWVAEGTYIPSEEVGGAGDRYRSFQMKNGVNILGGFNGTETSKDQRDWHAHESTLSCDLNIQGDDSDNCYRVIFNNLPLLLDNTAVLDGFTITGAAGSGMYNSGSSPTVKNCNFTLNHRGVFNSDYMDYPCSPIFYNCIFSNNIIVTNAPMENGSGMWNYRSSPELINCIFKNNRVTGGSGGGLNNNFSNPTIINCSFIENSAIHVDIGGAYIGGTGGGIYNDYDSQPTIVNSIFYGNTAVRRGGGVHSEHARNSLTIKNSIFWNNTAPTGKDFDFQYSDSPQVIYNDMEEVYIGEGNISEVPLFVDPASGDFHLQPDSPCINAATNVGSPEFDIDYDPRPLFIRTDIGIDEYTGWTENFDGEPIDFTDDPYFSISDGRLHFNGDVALASAEDVTWNGGVNPGGADPSPENSNYFENFIASVETFWEGRATDWPYGLLLCGRDITDSTSCLGHRINGNSEYSISYSRPTGKGFFVYNTFSSLNNPDGQNNTVTVKKVGPYYYFYINGVEVQRRIISDVYGGSVGLYAFHPVDAAFDNFAVSKIGYEAFEDDSNNVIEDFNYGTGGFSEGDFYKLLNNRFSFLGDRTDTLLFHIWSGGFDPGGWSPSSENTNYFDNFTVSVETLWDDGDASYAYGIIACTQENSAGFEDSIRFWVTQSGYYLIGKIVDTSWETLVGWTESNLITPDGRSTKLSIQKDGTLFHFSIGDTVVQSLSIGGLPGGGVGIEASQYVDVSFDNFSIIRPGTPPSADAGGDQSLTEGTTVVLNGSNSSDDIGISSYRWYQLAGPPVVLSNPTIEQPMFTAPSIEDPKITLAFQLRVTDDNRLHDSDITVVEVSCTNVNGDVDGNCSVGLGDGIISLQVAAEKSTPNVRSDYVSSDVDVNGDNKVGIEEAVNALREEAGL